jgi:3-oxoacyl-[acyl-carrier-protein] synthase II
MKMDLGVKKVGFAYSNKVGNEGFNEFMDLKNKMPQIQNYDPNSYIPVKGKKYMSNGSKLYCNLAFQCLLDKIEDYDKSRIGLYNCTDMPHLEDSIMFDVEAKQYGINGVSPMLVPNTLANVCSGQMAILSGINGINFTMSSGCISVANALIIANLHICENFIDAAILVSMEMASAMHSAIRQQRLNTSIDKTLYNSPELGASILVGNRDDNDLAAIVYIASALAINHSVENTFEELLHSIPTRQVDTILIDSGTSFIKKSLIESIVKNIGLNAHLG